MFELMEPTVQALVEQQASPLDLSYNRRHRAQPQ